MKTVNAEALDAAEGFLLRNARLIDRLRFAHLFRDGSAEAVHAALTAYRNDDGGFGNALEPDLRGAASQPQPVEVAFHLLDELSPDLPFDGPLVQAACDYLVSISTDAGGVPFVLPSVVGTPAAPWWLEPTEHPADLNPTAPIAGLLHKHGVRHPFVDRATEFSWTALDALTDTNPYEARAILPFLDHVADRDRAEATFARLAPMIAPHVTLDPHATGEAHFPLDFAPTPGGFGRRLTDDATIETHLDALVDAQDADGAWRPNFPAWTPVTSFEWSGHLTVSRLATLRAYGRL